MIAVQGPRAIERATTALPELPRPTESPPPFVARAWATC